MSIKVPNWVIVITHSHFTWYYKCLTWGLLWQGTTKQDRRSAFPCCCMGLKRRRTWLESQCHREQRLECWRMMTQWWAGDQRVGQWQSTDVAHGKLSVIITNFSPRKKYCKLELFIKLDVLCMVYHGGNCYILATKWNKNMLRIIDIVTLYT